MRKCSVNALSTSPFHVQSRLKLINFNTIYNEHDTNNLCLDEKIMLKKLFGITFIGKHDVKSLFMEGSLEMKSDCCRFIFVEV